MSARWVLEGPKGAGRDARLGSQHPAQPHEASQYPAAGVAAVTSQTVSSAD